MIRWRGLTHAQAHTHTHTHTESLTLLCPVKEDNLKFNDFNLSVYVVGA